MVLKELVGDLLESKSDVICHQVNCQAVFATGLSRAIRRKWPIVNERYTKFLYNNYEIVKGEKKNAREFLGLCQITKVERDPEQYVVSLFGQDQFGMEKIQYTDYDALFCSLVGLRRLVLFGDYGIKSIAFPYGMGCGTGCGGDWDKILDMIKAVFGNLDITIEIWKRSF